MGLVPASFSSVFTPSLPSLALLGLSPDLSVCLSVCLSSTHTLLLETKVPLGKPRSSLQPDASPVLQSRDPGARVRSPSRFSHSKAGSFTSPVSAPTFVRFLTFVLLS